LKEAEQIVDAYRAYLWQSIQNEEGKAPSIPPTPTTPPPSSLPVALPPEYTPAVLEPVAQVVPPETIKKLRIARGRLLVAAQQVKTPEDAKKLVRQAKELQTVNNRLYSRPLGASKSTKPTKPSKPPTGKLVPVPPPSQKPT
jgi:hypothetical protein